MYMGTIPDHFNGQAANAINFDFVLVFGEENYDHNPCSWQLYCSGSLSLCTMSNYYYLIRAFYCDLIDTMQGNTIYIMSSGLLSAAIIELIVMGDVGVLMVTPL